MNVMKLLYEAYDTSISSKSRTVLTFFKFYIFGIKFSINNNVANFKIIFLYFICRREKNICKLLEMAVVTMK